MTIGLLYLKLPITIKIKSNLINTNEFTIKFELYLNVRNFLFKMYERHIHLKYYTMYLIRHEPTYQDDP